MSFAEWNKILSVGNKEVDGHHQHLIIMLNQLYEQINSGNIAISPEKMVDELTDYATYHFAIEERLMRAYKYPHMDSHVKEHQIFIKKIIEYQKTLVRGQNVLFLDLVIFLKDWLFNHITTNDIKLGQFLISLGIS